LQTPSSGLYGPGDLRKGIGRRVGDHIGGTAQLIDVRAGRDQLHQIGANVSELLQRCPVMTNLVIASKF
jgi:hypothetical protein